VKCWGQNEYGELGNGRRTWSDIPVKVSGLSSGVAAISAGWQHTCALMDSGDVKCWGDNHYGELGSGGSKHWRATPVGVSGLSAEVVAISAGGCPGPSHRSTPCETRTSFSFLHRRANSTGVR